MLIPLMLATGWFPLELPPLHPILVNFTAALVPVSFAADLLGRWFKRDTLLATGWWTLLFAAMITPLTAAAGWVWMRSMGDMDHPQMPVHQWLGIGIAVVLIAWAIWRGIMFRQGRAPGSIYLILTALLVATLVVQGHLGGTMSFGSSEAVEQPVDHNQGNLPTSKPASHVAGWSDHIDLKD